MPALYRSAKMLARKWDGEFESGFLQRGVQCELIGSDRGRQGNDLRRPNTC